MKTENVEDIYELTPVQKGVLFHCLYDDETQLYFFQLVYSADNRVNIDDFETAWQLLIDRHTILRSGFYWEDIENPLQVVYKQVKVPINHYDWRNLERVEQEDRLKSFIESDRKQGF
ncbi:MAG: condensation domain-containing protein, partial [Cyanobacteria bacterium P01_H01_bin.35]